MSEEKYFIPPFISLKTHNKNTIHIILSPLLGKDLNQGNKKQPVNYDAAIFLVRKSKTSFQLCVLLENFKFMTLEPFSYDFWAFKFSFAALMSFY